MQRSYEEIKSLRNIKIQQARKTIKLTIVEKKENVRVKFFISIEFKDLSYFIFMTMHSTNKLIMIRHKITLVQKRNY